MSTYNKKSITQAHANRLIQRACEKATELGMGIAVTIVDESGVLKSFSRMDGAALIAIDASRKKAVTAVGFGMPTGAPWHDFIKDDPILANGVQSLDQFTLLGGGFPVQIDGEVVGAIGVSGGHYSQDEACARAALETV